MQRYFLNKNQIIDTFDNNRVIGSYTDDQIHRLYDMVKRANRGESEFRNDEAWAKEQRRIRDAGGHIAGLSDF